MKVPLSWLREYVRTDATTEQIAHALSISSAEVSTGLSPAPIAPVPVPVWLWPADVPAGTPTTVDRASIAS